MGEKRQEIFEAIKKSLLNGPKSISEISKEAGINWRTAEENLELLKNFGVIDEKKVDDKTRTFYYRDSRNYFGLLVNDKDHEKISSFYYHIKKFSRELFNQDPTKTQAYKILWKVNGDLKLSLPIGWYKYGPCCVQIYRNNELEEVKLSKHELQKIRDVVSKYGGCDNLILQKKIYDEADNRLYQVKEALFSRNFSSKEELYPLLMDLIKYSPPEAVDVVTDFSRATLLLGLENTRECFEFVWKYIATLMFKGSLKEYYTYNIDYYFENLDNLKKDAQIFILQLMRCHTKQIQEAQS